MSVPRHTSACRRALARRLFFCLPFLFLPSLGPNVGDAANAQTPSSTRILRRHVRVARETDGAYRLIEALDVAGAPTAVDPLTSAPLLSLVVLPEGAVDVHPLGGDVALEQVVHDPPSLALVGPPPRSDFKLAFTYRLPAASAGVGLRSHLPVDELLVDVEQGNVEARPGRDLRPAGEVGSAARPARRYVARDLPPEGVVRLTLVRRRVDARERVAVFGAVALVAAAAGIAVWRRGSFRPPGREAGRPARGTVTASEDLAGEGPQA